MYNIVFYRELESAGVSTRLIRQAQECCLLKLCNGVYTVTLVCGIDSHRRIARFVEDTAWTDRHWATPPQELRNDYHYQELLRRLRILHYPRYRADDTIWGTSAAMLQNIPLLGIDAGPISVAHPRSSSKTREIHRSNRLVGRADRIRHLHLELTPPVRTSLDLIHIRGQQAGFAAMETVLRQVLLTRYGAIEPKFGYPPDFLRLARGELVDNWYSVIERLTTGQATARRMCDALNPKSESIAESYCSFDLKALDIDGFDQQVKIYDDAGFVSRTDFVHRETMTILEADGVGKYIKVGRELMNRESDQHNRLLALGYTVVRFRFKELLNLSVFATKLFSQTPELRKHVHGGR